MFCRNCGRQLADGSKFCSSCGANQDTVPATKKKIGHTVAIAVAGIAVLGVTVLLAVLLLGSLGNEQPKPNGVTYSAPKEENLPEQTTSPQQTAPSTDTAKKGEKGVLPSPDAFFGGNLARLYDEDDYQTDGEGRLQSKGWKLTFKSNSEAMDGFKAYAELVGGGDYAVTLAEYSEDTRVASAYFRYVFECDGDDDPEESFYQLLETDRPMQGDLLIEIANHGNMGVCYLIMHYDPNYFTFIDSGEMYSDTLSDLSGAPNNNSDTPSNSGSAIKTPCPFCNGGNCKECGGDGLIYSYALDSKDTVTCGASLCNNGKCTNCGGDGWTD